MIVALAFVLRRGLDNVHKMGAGDLVVAMLVICLYCYEFVYICIMLSQVMLMY